MTLEIYDPWARMVIMMEVKMVKPMGRWSWDDMMVDPWGLPKESRTVMLKVKLMETNLKKETIFSLRIHPFFHKQQKVIEKIENQIQSLTVFPLISPYFFSKQK